MQIFSVLGVMSGTSVDGLDLALCSFKPVENLWKLEIEKTKFIAYDPGLRQKLLNAHLLNAEDLKLLDICFGEFVAEKINEFLKEYSLRVDLIASHGHTVFHRPDAGFTYQIGNGEVIAKKTNITVVCDFRTGDVALGGQGAPLVPIGDELLFGDYDACLNLGGFSNISFRDTNNKRIAYDICPVNIVLNKFAMLLGYDYDSCGKIAASGKTNLSLLSELDNIEFYTKKYPKSLGREWVEKDFLPLIDKYKELPVEDILNTVTLHIANQISLNLRNLKNVLITGGGTFNKFLIENIRQKTKTQLIIPDDELVNFKEAIVFAFLGLLRYLNKTNCLSSVTGAKRDSCCGMVCMP